MSIFEANLFTYFEFIHFRGAYLYRKEARKKRRRKLSERVGELIGNNENVDVPATTSDNTLPTTDPTVVPPPEFDIDYYSSSVESSLEEEKVYMQMGDILKSRLEYDHKLITQELVSSYVVTLNYVAFH